jgi:hypothetical protein
MDIPKPLEVTQNDIDTFLNHHSGLMAAYYMSFIGTANTFSKEEGWNGVYVSLRTQIERKSAWSIDPARSEEERASWRQSAQDAILNLCYVTIFHKDTIDKVTMTKIFGLIQMMRFMHPIGEAEVEADLVFKDKVVSALLAIGNALKEK